MATETAQAALKVLDRQYLEMRAKILELAACLDRLDRAEGDLQGDARVQLIRKGLAILLDEQPTRAEQVQLLFSRPYDEQWRGKFGV